MTTPREKSVSVKYGWEICDEVQRFVSDSSDAQFVPMSAYQAIERRLAIAKTALERIAGITDDQWLNKWVTICEPINDARKALKEIEG